MSFEVAERLARSLLFEGYVLYPYRASSLKNRQRWMFGSLYPPAFAEAAGAGDRSTMRTECLIAGPAPSVRVSVRFLQLARISPEAAPDAAPFQQAVERRIEPPALPLAEVAGEERTLAVSFVSSVADTDGPGTDALDASVAVSAFRLEPALWKVRIDVRNESVMEPAVDRSAAHCRTLASTHTLLGCEGGRFLSLLEPEPAFACHAQECKNDGTWPILVGPTGIPTTMLSSPIILYDFPKIADESAGDLFDSTEIDEILSLRILTLTEDERREVLRTDPRARALLERTEAMSEEDLLRLHGSWRPGTERGAVARRRAFSPGDAVVIRPGPRGDVMDLALAGEAATVVKVEEDMEGRLHYAVTVDCDPGKDLGELGQPGHRFFFSESELERVS